MQVLFPLEYLQNRQTCLIGDVLNRVSGLKAFTDRYFAQCLWCWTVLTGRPENAEFAGPKLVKEKLAEFDRKLQFSLRQFAVGFLDPDEPVARPLATHNIHVQSMVGGAIQQGTTGSTQNVSTTINLGDVRAAFAQLNDALKSAELPTPADSEMRADLDTIKPQLNKEAPSTTILQEAGRSLRTSSEGLAANVLALPSAAGLEALLKALGVL